MNPLKDFKLIPGYSDYYINSDGEVLSTKGGSPKKLSQSLSDRGYNYVNLYKNGDTKTIAVHKLVAKLFVPNPENKPCVNHKDANKVNNEFTNLEWCTYQENNTHARENGLYSKGEDHGLSKMTKEKVRELRRMYGAGEYTYTELGKLFDIDRRTASRIVNKELWTHV